MSYNRLLSGTTNNRRLFIYNIYHEMNSNAIANTHGRKNWKTYFLELVEGNEQLSEKEKQYCREYFIYDFELQNVLYKWGEPRECGRCQMTRYSDRFCEKCISLHLQGLFNTWTSGSEIVDNFIHQSQILSSLPNKILEWIPFEEFKSVTKLTEGGFSS